jgi:hypothetical protein
MLAVGGKRWLNLPGTIAALLALADKLTADAAEERPPRAIPDKPG